MPTTPADYLVTRLKQLKVETLFGVVGVPCADFFAAAARGRMQVLPNSSDLEAGYAADGYARVRGVGVVSVSYGPGTLSLVNALAAAYVEKSAIVLVSGGPSSDNLSNEQNNGVLFSHSTGKKDSDFKVVHEVVVEAVQIKTVASAPGLIDKALVAAITHRRPVYIEVAKDLWRETCEDPRGTLLPTPAPPAGERALAASLLTRLNAARNPILLFGEEIHRYGLMDLATRLRSKTGIRWSTTTLGKSVVEEPPAGTPGFFVGVHSGSSATAAVKQAFADSGFILSLGCVFSSGYGELVRTKKEQMARAYDGKLRTDRSGSATIVPADLKLLITEMLATFPAAEDESAADDIGEVPEATAPPTGRAITHDLVFERIKANMNANWLFIADTYLSISPAAGIPVQGVGSFMADAAWASIGHSVGAAVGAACAGPKRPLVLCGDGGFQMISMAMSTMVKAQHKTVVMVVDNGLYGHEQFLLGRRYFDNSTSQPLAYAVLSAWDYPALAAAMRVPNVREVKTDTELDDALKAAAQWNAPGLISIKMPPRDLPSLLR